ncbi:hypothetical protein [Nonomuraea typhae]|nr:hypothetical protein [Nonomuraea typhae]
MAKDDDSAERLVCAACLGERGNWEDVNGTDDNKGRHWLECRACGGKGYQ